MSLIQTLLDPIEEIKQQFSDEAKNQEDNDKNETINNFTGMENLSPIKQTQYYGREFVRITNKYKKALAVELLKTNTLSLFFENYYKFCEENGCKQGCRQLHKKHFDIKNSNYLGIDLGYTAINYWKKLYETVVLREWALSDDEDIVVSKDIILAYQDGMTYEECKSKVRMKRNNEDDDDDSTVSAISHPCQSSTSNSIRKENQFTQSDKNIIQKRQLHKCANLPGSDFEKKYDYQCLLHSHPERDGNFGIEGCEIDHILPISLGGSSEIVNGQALCLSCHRVKSNFENKNRFKN
jgi:5-methylcytosine-specific restriction endonuclease McrA